MITEVVVDGVPYRVVKKATHIVIYKTYKSEGDYPVQTIYWNGRRRTAPKIGSIVARVLAACRD